MNLRATWVGVLATGITICVARPAAAQGAPPQGAAPACTTPKTFCDGADGYYASYEDRDKMASLTDPLLKELRTCLDAAGGRHVKPVVVARFDENGRVVASRIEAPGYESLPCVATASGKVATMKLARETSVRCEYGCPPPPAPTPAPPVVAPPVTQQPPPQPPPQQQPPPPQEPAKPAPRTEKVWYGYQTLIADGASVVLFVSGSGAKSGGVVAAGVVSYILVTPVIHFVHGNIGPGFGSMGLRILLPPLGTGIGALAGLIIGASGKDNAFETASGALSGVAIGAVVGFVSGAAIASIVDAAGLAYEKQTVEPSASLRPRKPWFTLTPTFDVQKDRAALGVGGTF